MTVPIIDPAETAFFCRIIVDINDYEDTDPSTKNQIEALCLMAEEYMKNYTGLASIREVDTDYDNNETLKYCGKVIVAEAWDNRNISTSYTAKSPLVTSILNLYCVNYVPGVEE